MKISVFLSALIALLFATPRPAATAQDELAAPIKVMSFNIRFGSAQDGENAWPNRKSLVRDTIVTFAPDLLGVQEALEFQVAYLQEGLDGYAFHGAGRSDGETQGEYCGIFYRTDRWQMVDNGHFWLSESPNVPGSKSWDSSLPRMVSWIRVRDRRSGDRSLVFANTHFDHRGQEARKQSAQVIRDQLIDGTDDPIILAGDFNCTENDPPFQQLQSDDRPLVDSYRVIHPEAGPMESTLSGWSGRRQGRRIDWILHSQELATINAAIDRSQYEGRYPSDHYPVTAVIEFRNR